MTRDEHAVLIAVSGAAAPLTTLEVRGATGLPPARLARALEALAARRALGQRWPQGYLPRSRLYFVRAPEQASRQSGDPSP